MRSLITEEILYEFRGESNSFLIGIRCDLEWSHTKFVKLLNTMKKYCEQRNSNDYMDVEIAQGFWFISWYIKE